MRTPFRIPLLVGALFALAIGPVLTQAPSIAASAILHPARRPLTAAIPLGCEDTSFPGEGVQLRGWKCGTANRHGTVVFLHGVADNRSGATGIARRFLLHNFDVIAYDSRAHGESGGDVCTYGYYEKADLRRVLDSVPSGPVVVIGASLGGAVALQAAAEEPRITAVVAAEVFADLRSVVRDRAPFFVPDAVLERAFRVVESRGRLEVDRVSPADAASRITVPVLLIHGARDVDTPPEHSQRVLANLRGRKRLLLIDGAGHNQSLSGGAVWNEIERWVVGQYKPKTSTGLSASPGSTSLTTSSS